MAVAVTEIAAVASLQAVVLMNYPSMVPAVLVDIHRQLMKMIQHYLVATVGLDWASSEPDAVLEVIV